MVAVGCDDDRPGLDPHAAPGGPRRGSVGQGGAGIHHDGDLDARADEVGHEVVSAVVVGRHDDPLTCRDGIAVEVGADGSGEHHPGAVVAAEHHADVRAPRSR